MDEVLCIISDEGLKFVVEDSKCFQSIAYIQKTSFSHFKIKPSKEPYSFGLSLSAFTEYLNSFVDNDSSSMKLIYFGPGSLFVLNLIQSEDYDDEEDDPDNDTGENQIFTEYLLRIKNCEDMIDFEEAEENLANSTIFDGPDFYEILNDIDKTIDELEIEIDSNHNIKMKSCGILQYETNIDIPRACDIIVSGTLKQATKFRYKFVHIKLMLRTLVLASKISLKTFLDGLLKLQLVVNADDEEQIFVEYFLVPSIETD